MSRATQLQEQYLKDQQNKIPEKVIEPVEVQERGGLIVINWRQDNKILIPFSKHRIWPWRITNNVLKVCRQVVNKNSKIIHKK